MNKKLYFFLALILIFGSSCSTKQITSATTQVETPSTVDSSPSNGASVEGVIFTPVEYYTTSEQRAKIISAGKKMNEVNHSQCAYDFLKNRKFIDNQSKSSVEIANLVKNAKGTIPVEIYYRCLGRAPFCTSAVAYRNVGEKTIHLNGNAFSVYMSDCEWAETLDHESVGHSLLEFDHSYNWTPTRDFSVPYSLGGSENKNGNLYKECCR